jgi:hypothetical protein
MTCSGNTPTDSSSSGGSNSNEGQQQTSPLSFLQDTLRFSGVPPLPTTRLGADANTRRERLALIIQAAIDIIHDLDDDEEETEIVEHLPNTVPSQQP